MIPPPAIAYAAFLQRHEAPRMPEAESFRWQRLGGGGGGGLGRPGPLARVRGDASERRPGAVWHRHRFWSGNRVVKPYAFILKLF